MKPRAVATSIRLISSLLVRLDNGANPVHPLITEDELDDLETYARQIEARPQLGTVKPSNGHD